MDRETATEIRENLLAMRAIVMFWRGADDPDTPLTLEWLHGYLDRAVQAPTEPGPLAGHLAALEDYVCGMLRGARPQGAATLIRHEVNAALDLLDELIDAV